MYRLQATQPVNNSGQSSPPPELLEPRLSVPFFWSASSIDTTSLTPPRLDILLLQVPLSTSCHLHHEGRPSCLYLPTLCYATVAYPSHPTPSYRHLPYTIYLYHHPPSLSFVSRDLSLFNHIRFDSSRQACSQCGKQRRLPKLLLRGSVTRSYRMEASSSAP